jgi:hypothetical protein
VPLVDAPAALLLFVFELLVCFSCIAESEAGLSLVSPEVSAIRVGMIWNPYQVGYPGEPFDPGEVVSLHLRITLIPRRYRDAVSRCFRLRADITHFCA